MTEKTEGDAYCQAYKCGGIPWHPAKHSFFKKRLADVSDEYIRQREKRVEKFLKKFDWSDEIR